jgi:hypothetical protein
MLNLNGLGHLISQSSPIGNQFVDVFNQVANPVMQIADPFINIFGEGAKAFMTLPVTHLHSAGKVVQQLATPTMLYLVIAVVAIGGVAVIQGGFHK